MRDTITKLILVILTVISAIGLFSVSAQDEKFSDPLSGVTLSVPQGWEVTTGDKAADYILKMPNPNLVPMGANLRKNGLLLLKLTNMQNLIPNVQIAVHDQGGLKINVDNLEYIEREIERIYSEKCGTRFRLFLLEEQWINGLRAVLIEGVYVWRTNNIKIQQYLIPGSNKFYSLTYSCKEMEFASHRSEAAAIMQSVRISDAPIELDWLWDFLKFVVLVGIVTSILWGMFFANSITPGSRKKGLSLFNFLKSDSSSTKNPFEHK